MNAGVLTLLIGIGAGAIALWIDVRFPNLAPSDLVKAVLRVAIAIALVYASGPVMRTLTETENGRVALLGVFGIGFPSIVFSLLAGLWMIKVAQRMLGGTFR